VLNRLSSVDYRMADTEDDMCFQLLALFTDDLLSNFQCLKRGGLLVAFNIVHCSVVLCANDSRYKDPYLAETGKKLHFHKFPDDPKRQKE
jgi:hypothetical protein